MLIGVHVQVIIGQGFIRLYVVVEFDDLDLDALFFCFFGYLVHDFSVRSSYAYFDFFVSSGFVAVRAAARCKDANSSDEAGCEKLFNR